MFGNGNNHKLKIFSGRANRPLTEGIARLVAAGHPVAVSSITDEELDANPALVKSMSVQPPRGTGRIRTIRIGSDDQIDFQPCGGTHPRSTSEVGVVLVVGRERYKGGSRVRFVCGNRALEFTRAHVGLLDRLAALVSAPHAGVPDAVERLRSQLAAAEKRIGDLLEAAIAGETYEYTEMYPGFAKTARAEGFEDIAEWFETLARAERSHAGRFKKGLDSMGQAS